MASARIPEKARRLVVTTAVERCIGALEDGAACVFRGLRPVRYWVEAKLFWRTEHARSLSQLKDKFQGRPMLVVGNGPSLNHTPLDEFAGIPAIGMNKIDLLFPRVRWRPTIVLCANRHVMSQHQERFDVIGIPVYYLWQSRWFMRPSRPPGATFFLNLSSNEFSTDITRGVGISGTITYAALQFAYYMGADPVILVGVDHHFFSQGKANALVLSQGEDRDHFDPEYFGKGRRWNLPDLPESERGFRKARDAFAAAGRRIWDATVEGRLRVFDKVTIAEAIRIAQRRG